MKFRIRHEIRGRIRVGLSQKRMSCRQADGLAFYLSGLASVRRAKVYERTCDAVIWYEGGRGDILRALLAFDYAADEPESGGLTPDAVPSTGRELNNSYQERLIGSVAWHYAKRYLLPTPVRIALTVTRAAGYLLRGLKSLWQRRLEVSVLDATAVTVSLLQKDYNTAGSIMFLLGIGELLEEWTHKRSVDDLARTMSLQVDKVWRMEDGRRVLTETARIRRNDVILVHMGNVIPFDGIVTEGEAMVNQSSLTGEPVPVEKRVGATVYAGTVVEEGELLLRVTASEGHSRYEKIVHMIEESEKLKSGLESRAEHLADRLVPYSLGGTALTYLLTRNATKAMSILMVDFCCALKLAMPISVLSAIREAGNYRMTVKGGKYLEAVAEADTIVFDKTGTLTKATPTVVDVVAFDGREKDELLRIAACLEEHFPHSMAKAVVDAAKERGLEHEEMHSKVEYLVAHGIASSINGKRAVIGSHHFVFEDENCVIPEGKEALFASLPQEYSHLYLAIDQSLAAVVLIEDPLRPEAAGVLRKLRRMGISRMVMMTGDSTRTADAVAERVGVDVCYSEVLPEDKASFVEREQAKGHKLIMIGDGINDSPALSAADVGIAISDGAQLAREIADITIAADDLRQLVVLRELSIALMERIRKNYRRIVGFNSGLIALGLLGILQPATSALLHNASTLVFGMDSMKKLLEEK